MVSLFTSCAEPKNFKDNKGKEFTAQPFGWGNETSQKHDTVVYYLDYILFLVEAINFHEIIFLSHKNILSL